MKTRTAILMAACAAVAAAAFAADAGRRDGKKSADELPVVDLTRDEFRQTVIAMGTPEVYQGHPTTLLTPDGKTLFCVWTINHGGGCGPAARSDDGGRTWTRIDDMLPAQYKFHRNCPTLQTVPRPDGSGVNFCVFSANCEPGTGGGLGIMVSSDNGKSWRVAPPAPHLSAGMPPTGLIPLKDGTCALFGQVRKDPRVKTDRATDDQNVWMSITRDGGLTWGEPRVVATADKKNLCEPFALRSPDGSEIALLIRENRHTARSMMCFSRDEGKTWTKPVDTCWGLTGDRHEGIQLPDGRWVVAFRDRALGSSTYGQYVAWVGTYDDLRNGRPGQYRIHLLKSWSGSKHGGWKGDTGYSGVELLPDGTILCTTYVKLFPDARLQSVACTRFRIEETDRLAAKCAEARSVEVTLAPGGDIRFGDGSGRVFRSLAALPGWHGLSTKGGWEIKKPGVASFSLMQGMNEAIKAEARLDQLPDGKVKIAYSFTPVEDVRLVVLACSFTQPASEVKDRPWNTPNRKGTFSRPANEGIHVMGEKGTEVSVALGATGRMLKFVADREQGIAIQDNWRWGDTYSLRLGTLSERTWKKGETQTYSFTVSADVPLVAKSAEPTVIARGKDWIPLAYRKEIEAGSALDFSHMGFTDAPAGKHGWMKNAGGHFEFEGRPGKPVRLYGVNLCGTANFPEHDEAEMIVTRFKRLGYNAIRLHHHDAGTVKGSADGLTLNAENMDKFDYLLATAIREGLYLTTDLFVSRNHVIRWRHIGVDRDGIVDMQLFKALCALYDPAFENWCAYARNFLTHVNPYTGRAYKDEPALSLISLVNEGGLFMGWGRETEKDERVREAWRKWVLAKRAADPSFYPDADPDNPPKSTYTAAFALFMGEMEAKMVARMKAFLRSIGCKALLTNDNCGPHHAPLQRASAEYDYVDDHFYVDHPVFLEKRWSLPSRCGNRNPIQTPVLPPCRLGFTRMADKPFTVTEWNFSGPGMFRGVGGILTGAIAALQDWDGMWRFAYSHSREGLLENQSHSPGYFNLGTDPLGQASDRASICLFLRGDIAPLAQGGVSLLITPASEKPEGTKPFSGSPSWSDAAWNMRVSSCLAPPDGVRVIPREQAEEPSVTNWVRSVAANPSLGFDRARGSFTIDTPRTCGGFAPGGAFSAGPISVTLGGAAATVWASSLDGAPVSASRRILVTHLTDVQGEDTKFADPERTILLRFGKGSLVRNGTAKVALALAEPSAYAVYELETSGKRLGTVPADVKGGKLCFTAAVDGPHGARILYEVVRK